MRYKIAFFDIDGTLIDMATKKMSERTRQTLLRLKEQGVILCIATGRPLRSVPKFENPSFDVYLTFNGSYCIAEGKEIHKRPILHADVLRIIENAKAIGRPVSVATSNRMGANGSDADLVEYYSFAGQVVEIAEDFDALMQDEVYQVMMGACVDERAAILDGVESAKIAAWWDRAVDIIPADGGKGEAVKKILEYYHLDRSEAIAFGDGENDIEMLEAAGTGVAMGNATDVVKGHADVVCRSVAEDGIYHYCVENGMMGE